MMYKVFPLNASLEEFSLALAFGFDEPPSFLSEVKPLIKEACDRVTMLQSRILGDDLKRMDYSSPAIELVILPAYKGEKVALVIVAKVMAIDEEGMKGEGFTATKEGWIFSRYWG